MVLSFLNLRGVFAFSGVSSIGYILFVKSMIFIFFEVSAMLSILYPVTIVLAPAISALALLVIGRYVSRHFAIFFILSFVCLSFLGSLCIFFIEPVGWDPLDTSVSLFEQQFFYWDQWVCAPYFDACLGWVFDSLSVSMLVLVASVSFFVHIYSINYMWNDPSLVRFLSYLSIFTFFMFVLATSSNFLQLFLGWEGVGLMSYLLVGFWYERQQASRAAWKAVFVNRVGDFLLLLGMCISFFLFQTFDFADIFFQVHVGTFVDLYLFDKSFVFFDLFESFLACRLYIEVLVFLLFFGAVAKSAQFGLHTWLPDAMEGPTPVSALIHAATMVTAGVYVLIRLAPVLNLSVLSPYYMALFGSITCVYAGILAAAQVDAKKLIAYSTMSQLGYMILGCSEGNYNYSFFHLWVHGYVKALLFLGAGVIIHFLMDEQNMARAGALRAFMPFSFLLLSTGSVSLMAVPLFSGYFSKEGIVELASVSLRFGLGEFVHIFSLLGTFFTGFYSVKLIVMLFAGVSSYPRGTIRSIYLHHLQPRRGVWLYVPLLVLALLSIFIGGLAFELFVFRGAGYVIGSSSVTSAWIRGVTALFSISDTPPQGVLDSSYIYVFLLSPIYKLLSSDFALLVGGQGHCWPALPFFVVLVGAALSVIFYCAGYHIFYNSSAVWVVARKMFFDKVVNTFICRRGLLTFYKTLFLSIDRGALEFFGPSGLAAIFLLLSRVLARFQRGSVVTYLAIMIWSTAILFFLFSLFLV